jgi:hypothetical protein
MVQFSPDTPTASPSGYRDKDREIEQFSLTHFDGAGCPNNEDIPIMPFVGDVDASNLESSYAKTSEKASPGYYAVDLDRYHVRTELTATTRTGTRPGTIAMSGDRIEGTAMAGGFCNTTTTFPIYFVIAFDQPITSSATHAERAGTRALVTFDTTTSRRTVRRRSTSRTGRSSRSKRRTPERLRSARSESMVPPRRRTGSVSATSRKAAPSTSRWATARGARVRATYRSPSKAASCVVPPRGANDTK